MGWDENAQFLIPGEALEHFREALDKGAAEESAWNKKFAEYKAAFPELAADYEMAFQGELKAGWEKAFACLWRRYQTDGDTQRNRHSD